MIKAPTAKLLGAKAKTKRKHHIKMQTFHISDFETHIQKINLCPFCTQPHHIGATGSNIAAVVCKECSESQKTLIISYFSTFATCLNVFVINFARG